jgi:thiamine-monophosphate kinase
MTELQVVEWLKRAAPSAGRGVVLGIGDDCAIFRPSGSSEDLLFTTDQFIEGVHFRSTDSPESIGHRALGRGLSDIAAMGGKPRFCLLSLTKPRRLTDAWLKRFYRGLLRLADNTRTVLAGGDLSSGKLLACDIVVCGSVRRGHALRRDGARPGDRIFVSGPLGGPASRNYPARMFEPRLRLGRTLRASACIDITDGLALDLHRLCCASKVSAKLEIVPLAAGASEMQALCGGDEYELLFTSAAPTPGCIEIGIVDRGNPGEIRFRGVPIALCGHDHFSNQHSLEEHQ